MADTLEGLRVVDVSKYFVCVTSSQMECLTDVSLLCYLIYFGSDVWFFSLN